MQVRPIFLRMRLHVCWRCAVRARMRAMMWAMVWASLITPARVFLVLPAVLVATMLLLLGRPVMMPSGWVWPVLFHGDCLRVLPVRTVMMVMPSVVHTVEDAPQRAGVMMPFAMMMTVVMVMVMRPIVTPMVREHMDAHGDSDGHDACTHHAAGDQGSASRRLLAAAVVTLLRRLAVVESCDDHPGHDGEKATGEEEEPARPVEQPADAGRLAILGRLDVGRPHFKLGERGTHGLPRPNDDAVDKVRAARRTRCRCRHRHRWGLRHRCFWKRQTHAHHAARRDILLHHHNEALAAGRRELHTLPSRRTWGHQHIEVGPWRCRRRQHHGPGRLHSLRRHSHHGLLG
mmetsp:Transcript_106445/g.227303  ORF Transcript_106445/g.227303 Transcript_106445/m.227303 type:complete len:345 (-) Transcript_106445:136-1170(-)